MSYAGTFPAFANEHRNGLAISVVGHVAILLMFSSSLMFSPKQPLPQLSIEAVVIDEGAINRAAAAEQKRTADAARRKRAEQQRQTRLEQERQVVEQRRRDEVAAAAEQKRLSEQQRVADARKAEERARIEKEQAAAKQRALEERQQREAAARAETERQRMIAAAEQEDLERREAEMRSSMEEEEALQEAQASGELEIYKYRIQKKVELNWLKPASAKAGLVATVQVRQLPNGDVIDVQTIECNCDDIVKRSIENAVRQASPLPIPDNRILFDRNLLFFFKPE
jgi:colicin import membrane protein